MKHSALDKFICVTGIHKGAQGTFVNAPYYIRVGQIGVVGPSIVDDLGGNPKSAIWIVGANNYWLHTTQTPEEIAKMIADVA